MIRFYISLFAGKLYLFFAKLTHNERSDKVAFLVDRICPDFLAHVKKPELVISVTGTNGKTTVTSLVTQMLKKDNKKVAYNDWGANLYSGHIRCFLDTVNIFNKSIKDAIILESDELTLWKTVKIVKPDYLIVTNICRDSIRRNAYPYYIYGMLEKAISYIPDTTLILNADDPISSFLGENNKKIFVSVDKYTDDASISNANDFTCCPKCNGKIEYLYRHYRHIGKFKCLDCNLESFSAEYKVSKINFSENKIVLNKKIYPLISNTIFNVFNESMVIALFKHLKYNDKFICESLEDMKIPASREDKVEVKGFKIYLRMAKGQNGSAASSVFESLAKDKSKKQLILILDEVYDTHSKGLDAEETITWLYDTDYEFLNVDNIEKIIIPSRLSFDYKLRLHMAGIDDNKFVCIDDYKDACNYLNLDKPSNIYVLYEVDDHPAGEETVKLIKERIEREVK